MANFNTADSDNDNPTSSALTKPHTDSIPVESSQRTQPIWWFFATLWFAIWHLFVTSTAWVDPAGRVPGPTGDNAVMLWNLGWVNYAVEHGSLGLWCWKAYYPDGFLFIYNTHTWLDGILYSIMSPILPAGFHGAILWANITMLLATVGTGLLTISSLRAWGVRHWPLLLLLSSAVTFSWFRMYALFGHYHFFGTQWMMLSLCILSWTRTNYNHSLKRSAYLCAAAGFSLGITALNDQTMAIFAAILAVPILINIFISAAPRKRKTSLAFVALYYASAATAAAVHLVPILITAARGKLHYHVDKSIPRLVDASSFIIPNDYHFLSPLLKQFRESNHLSWSEGTYLGIIPILLLMLCTITAVCNILQKNASMKVWTWATIAAWMFLIAGMGDRLMIGGELYNVMPGRILKEIPLFNNLRVPQRWVWPAHLCIVLASGTFIQQYLKHSHHAWLTWIPLVLAVIPPLEGRPAPMPPPVDFRNDPAIAMPGLVHSVKQHYTGGGVLTMPVEITYAHADILQFLCEFEISTTVVYTARMPFSVHELPWKGSAWTPQSADWLRRKQVSMIVFPFHTGDILVEYLPWVAQAKKAVPGIVVIDKLGNLL